MTHLVHASCVALGGRAVLITGKSGSGKSSLALELMAYGASLVADDQVALTLRGDQIIASSPPAISGLIEARGIGILNAQAVDSAALVVVIDLDQVEIDRVPMRKEITLLGQNLPLLHRPSGVHTAVGLLQFLCAGRSER